LSLLLAGSLALEKAVAMMAFARLLWLCFAIFISLKLGLASSVGDKNGTCTNFVIPSLPLANLLCVK
jgi:hypothetical protein